MSPTIGKLAGALAKAQSLMGAALKDSNNPFFKTKYADLASIIAAIKPIHDFGLSYSQHPIGKTGMVTLLMHESGEWVKSEMHMKPTKDDAQGQGSAQTYMRRYGLQAVCGIPADDDDGNAASEPNVKAYTTDQRSKILSALIKNKDPFLTTQKDPQEKWTNEIWREAADVARKYFNQQQPKGKK